MVEVASQVSVKRLQVGPATLFDLEITGAIEIGIPRDHFSKLI